MRQLAVPRATSARFEVIVRMVVKKSVDHVPSTLLEEITLAIDTLLQAYPGMEVQKHVPCLIEQADSDLSSSSANLATEHILPYARMVESVITGKLIPVPTLGKDVSVQQVAPDLVMGNIKTISSDQVILPRD